ncbi:MAG: hypothetical protein KGH72_02155 [Candidatus Micrarchaeota archaeon]|nr:hypothetical protein [Candidatus Micrarchaeota archaeon]
MKAIKLQSAMEYLMTYGWAILVIAVVMVALFSLGILGGGTPFGTTCLAQSGYVCSQPVFSSVTGNLLVTVGQASGNNWATANVVFVPAGTATTGILTPAYFTAANTGIVFNSIVGGLSAEQQTQVTVPINGVVTNKPFYAIGSTVQGTLWAEYTIAGPTSSANYFAQLATVTLKAS